MLDYVDSSGVKFIFRPVGPGEHGRMGHKPLVEARDQLPQVVWVIGHELEVQLSAGRSAVKRLK